MRGRKEREESREVRFAPGSTTQSPAGLASCFLQKRGPESDGTQNTHSGEGQWRRRRRRKEGRGEGVQREPKKKKKKKRMGKEERAKNFSIEEKPYTKSFSLWSQLSLTCGVNLGKSLSLWARLMSKMKGLGSMI